MPDITAYPKRLLLAGLALALLTGLGLGYLLFYQKEMPASQESKEHTHSSEESVWTCSMHPQIRKNESGDCPICGMELIPLADNTSSDPLVLNMTHEAVKLASIETSVIGSSSNSKEGLSLSGKIQVDERLAVSQVAHIGGRIEKLFVSFTGEKVRKGQKIADIYSPELISAQRELLEAVKLKDQIPGLLVAARQKLAYWKISPTRIQAIEESGAIQETVSIYADASGVVRERKVAVGDYVRQGEVLFDMESLDRVWVLFDAYEEDLAQVKVGDQIRFFTPSLPGREFNTRITFIDPVIDPVTRVASLRAEVKNGEGLLKPEMFVNGNLLPKTTTKQQVTVPRSAVLWTGTRSVVYVKVPDATTPSFRYQEVVLGERTGDAYAIKSGLESGAEVVTYGAFSIDAAAQLNNQQSMMNRLVNVEEPGAPGLPDYRLTTPDAFRQQLHTLVSPYMRIKDALVEAETKTAMNGAKAFLAELKGIDMSLIKGDAHLYWMQQMKALSTHGKRISEKGNIEKQREQFGYLSTSLIHTLQAFGTIGDSLYIQSCPMAFDNQGADWLSMDEEIMNPYFGDMMLHCGSVQSQIPPVILP